MKPKIINHPNIIWTAIQKQNTEEYLVDFDIGESLNKLREVSFCSFNVIIPSDSEMTRINIYKK